MSNKYELTNEAIMSPNRHLLYRIRSLVYIYGVVNAGDLGGYVESEKNLTHKGTAWVGGNAWVYGDAKIYDHARITGNAHVWGQAKVFGHTKVWGEACIYGNAKIYDSAAVYANAQIFDNTYVSDTARIYGDTSVFGDAHVFGDANINGRANVSGEAWISKSEDYFSVSSIGSRNDCVNFYRTKTGIGVTCGCFNGTLEEFARRVDETHGDNEHGQIYRMLIEVAKLRIKSIIQKEEQS